jgi:hypothetical protein
MTTTSNEVMAYLIGIQNRSIVPVCDFVPVTTLLTGYWMFLRYGPMLLLFRPRWSKERAEKKKRL